MRLDLLAIASHTDDAELGCSGTLIAHIKAGIKEESLLHFVELAAFNFVVAGTFVETELKQFVATAKIVGEKLIDKGEIVMNLADFKDFLAPFAGVRIPFLASYIIVARIVIFTEAAAVPAIFNIVKEFYTQLVRVETGLRARQRAGAVIGVAN